MNLLSFQLRYFLFIDIIIQISSPVINTHPYVYGCSNTVQNCSSYFPSFHLYDFTSNFFRGRSKLIYGMSV